MLRYRVLYLPITSILMFTRVGKLVILNGRKTCVYGIGLFLEETSGLQHCWFARVVVPTLRDHLAFSWHFFATWFVFWT